MKPKLKFTDKSVLDFISKRAKVGGDYIMVHIDEIQKTMPLESRSVISASLARLEMLDFIERDSAQRRGTRIFLKKLA